MQGTGDLLEQARREAEKAWLDSRKRAVKLAASPPLTDKAIAKSIRLLRQPSTSWGRFVAKSVLKSARENADKVAPLRVKAFEKQFVDRKLRVFLSAEKGKLAGSDAFSELYAYEGNLFAVPRSTNDKLLLSARRSGVPLGFGFAEAFAALVGFVAETAVNDYVLVDFSSPSSWSNVNVFVPAVVERLAGKRKRSIGLSGLIGLRAEIEFS